MLKLNLFVFPFKISSHPPLFALAPLAIARLRTVVSASFSRSCTSRTPSVQFITSRAHSVTASMPQPLAQTRRLTCRYWALGPECPDGVVCRFAHIDTGILAAPALQPGTCLAWFKTGACLKAKGKCFFEHRNVGVTGMYQNGRRHHSPYLTMN